MGSILAKRNGNQNYRKEYASQNASTLLEFYADYNKTFGIHNLDVMGGYSWQHFYKKYNETQYYNNELGVDPNNKLDSYLEWNPK